MKKGIDYIGVGVGAVIVSKDKRIFANLRGRESRNEKGKWEFPGGAVEFGDTLEETIRREMKEEFGIDIEVIDLLGVNNHIIPEEKQHWVSPCFVCRIKSGEPRILEPHKSDAIGWFTLEEISELPITVVTHQNIKSLLKKYPGGLPDFY